MPTRTTNYVTRLPFVVDPKSIVRNGGRQIDWDAVPETYRQGAVLVTAATDANTGATQITVSAITGDIPNNYVLYFGQAGEFARLNEKAEAGTTVLQVDATGTTIEATDTATYPGTGQKLIPAGKAMAERSTGLLIPRVDQTTTSEVATCFLETNAVEDDPSQSLSGFGCIIGGALYENLLPDATAGATTGTISSTYKNELVGNTSTPRSTGFVFLQYEDDRANIVATTT